MKKLSAIEFAKNFLNLFKFYTEFYKIKYFKIIYYVKKITQQGARTPDHQIKSLALYRLS